MNTKTTDSGVYKALINSSSSSCSIRRIRSFNVTVNGSGPSPAAIAGIIAAVLVLFAAAAAGTFYCHKQRKNERMVKNQTRENIQYSTVLTNETQSGTATNVISHNQTANGTPASKRSQQQLKSTEVQQQQQQQQQKSALSEKPNLLETLKQCGVMKRHINL
ncbi:hypothetical protein QQF64_019555 [Cirrhinus molitorella]|uniref:Uncharacterized protein n=1 Tax=Cirrhinus molitorella TaxID=172907 RepID=A0ABR3LJ50_9TELE